LTLRGELDAAIALYEKILPAFPLRERFAYETTRAYFAQALNLAGQHARAKEVVAEVLSGMVEQDHPVAVHFLEAHRQLALAEAGLENHDIATRIVEDLLDKHGAEDNPLLVGLLHKARAEIALLTKDGDKFAHHLGEMERRFRGTRNAALVTQWERLVDRANRSELVKFAAVHTHVDADPRSKSKSTTVPELGELSAAANPCEYALQLVLKRVNAKSGYLYVYCQDAMQLGAANGPSDAPKHLETALLQLAAQPPSEIGGEAPDEDEFGDETMAMDDWGAYQLRVLDTMREGRRVVVGGLILEARAQDVGGLDDSAFLHALSGALLDRRLTTIDRSTVSSGVASG
jgi:hypothetical protein